MECERRESFYDHANSLSHLSRGITVGDETKDNRHPTPRLSWLLTASDNSPTRPADRTCRLRSGAQLMHRPESPNIMTKRVMKSR
jgi:hypothetical protein